MTTIGVMFAMFFFTLLFFLPFSMFLHTIIYLDGGNACGEYLCPVYIASILLLANEVVKAQKIRKINGSRKGAYRVSRSLGDPRKFEPEFVHIPAGEFWMCKQVQETDDDVPHQEEPSDKVYLDDYWIGRYPVTVVEFTFFIEHSRPGEYTYPQEYGQYPVTKVSNAVAQAYCRWLSCVTGKTHSLPTREQWEKAVRGMLGTDARNYPWGNGEPNRTLCNIEHWFGATTQVGQFSPAGDGPKYDNAYGCADHITYSPSWRSGRQSRSDWHRYSDVNDSVGFRVVHLNQS